MHPLPSLLLLVVVALLGQACKKNSLSQAGLYVRQVEQAPADCEELGVVTGKGGGTLTDAYHKKKTLREGALSDARNEAARLGATHIVLHEPEQGTGVEETVTTFTVKGVAYRCEGVPPPVVEPVKEPEPRQERRAPNRNTGAGTFQ